MRWLLFLSRLSFICNVFFLIALSLQVGRWFQHEVTESTVIIVGYLMVMLLNPVTNLCYLVLLIGSRSKLSIVPFWLLISNFLFLILQIFYILYLNGYRYY